MKTLRMSLVTARHADKVVGHLGVYTQKPERGEVFTLDIAEVGEEVGTFRLLLHPADAQLLHDHLGALLRTSEKAAEHASHDPDPRLTR